MINKKTIKKFLKPSWKKILLAVLLVIISLLHTSILPERYFPAAKGLVGLGYRPEYTCYGFPVSFLMRESYAGGPPSFEFRLSDVQFGTKKYLDEYPFSDIIYKTTNGIDREIRTHDNIKLNNRFFVTKNTERIMFFLFMSTVLLVNLLFWYFSVCLIIYAYSKLKTRT